MGQKVHPTGIRLGIATDWTSKWYADSKTFPNFLETDLKVREFLKKKNSRMHRLVGSKSKGLLVPHILPSILHVRVW